MFGKRRPAPTPQLPGTPATEPVPYRELPDGTQLAILSGKGNIFVVKLLPGASEGHFRNVQVLTAPQAFTGTAEFPTQLFAVPAGTRGKVMEHYYAAANPTISIGDTCYLVDTHYSLDATPFQVAAINIWD